VGLSCGFTSIFGSGFLSDKFWEGFMVDLCWSWDLVSSLALED
jgi:hypothetical protein